MPLRVDAVSLSLTQPKLVVVVSDETSRRTIRYTWQSKEMHPLPASWRDSLQGEVEDRKARALAQAQGRILP